MRLDKLKALEHLFQRRFNPNETYRLLQMSARLYICWGVSNAVDYEDKALILTVNGMKHKGKVVISLGGNDLYIVTLLNGHNNIKETFEGIYFDELAKFIDEKIEKIPDYRY